MENRNFVFIARSLDGYIADRNGGLEWLNTIPNPEGKDLGYVKFLSKVDALVMGRITFEMVCSFEVDWPYTKPVFVISNTIEVVSEEYRDKAEVVKGKPREIIDHLNKKGYTQLYIDGGVTIQSFLKEDLIDDLIITTIPILLGSGIPLFGELPEEMEFEHVESELFLEAIVQNSYKRKRR